MGTTQPSRLSEESFPDRLGPSGRYELRQLIGRGGFGTVFLGRDTRYDGDVAIKLLRRGAADSLYRFKGEFRALADLTHPNLVRLYELGVEETYWFVVMELVDGVDLLRFARGDEHAADVTVTQPARSVRRPAARAAPPVDEGRLRRSFAQLAQGLTAIHAAGKLHRDLKPSNVLVAADERVVILDFGLVADADEKPGVFAGPGVGTPGYMAPEQLRAGRLTAAADWYAVGAMLHEALTGSVPHGTASPSLPADELGTICRAMIDPDPARRPSGREVLATLAPASRGSPSSSRSVPLIGRDVELATLDEALSRADAAPSIVRVIGPSGVGKSALLDVWLSRVRGRGSPPVLLRGRCLEHENVPFKAIDGVIDALAAHLAESPNVDGASLRPAMRMFPVLGGLLRDADRPAATGDADPRALREQALGCLRGVLRRIAADRGLVVCIDDAQWADAEGIRALADLVDPRMTGLLLVVSQRPDVETSAVFDEWLATSRLHVGVLPLRPLSESEARLLARSYVGDELAAQVARDAGGNPFIVQQLAECLREDATPGADIEISDLVARKLAGLPPAGRGLVEVVALSATPLSEAILAHAAELEGGDARIAMQAVERERLVGAARVEGRSLFSTLHDRIREEVVRQIAPDRLQARHRSIAGALSANGCEEPELLLHHYLGADDAEAATRFAMQAAERAEDVLAFERAAEHYGTVLRLGHKHDERSRLLERRGVALANAGRSAAAAECLQEAAASYAAPKREDDARVRRALERRSGELWLRSGHIQAGKEKLSEALRAVGLSMPRSRASAMVDSARRRLWFFVRGLDFTPRPEWDLPAGELERLDAMWSATTSLAMFDYLVADAIGVQHLLEALRVGEPKRVLRSLAFEAGFEVVIGGSFMDRRCDTILERMESLVTGIDDPYFRAWSLMARGTTAWFRGEWARAWESCRDAAEILRRDTRGTAWELAVCDVYGLSALTYLGDVATLERLVPESHRAVRERGDLYATTNLAFFESFIQLARDNPRVALELVERAIEPFPRSEFLMIHYGIAYAIAQAHLYLGDALAAWELIERDFPSWQSAGMIRARCVRVEIRYLRARAALALIEARADHRGLARKRLAEDVARLAGEGTPVATAMAHALRAASAKLEGHPERARALLESAIAGFEECHMKLHAAAARRHLARLAGGAPLVPLPGVTSPERMSAMLVAGFRT